MAFLTTYNIEMFYLNSTLNFGIMPVLVFQLGKPPEKKTADFEDIGIKGGWVLVSKPNFFYTRN